MKDKRFWGIIATAFLCRGVLLLAIGPNPQYAYVSDSPSYYVPAQSLRSTGSYSTQVDGQWVPELYRTPGYPVFLIPFLGASGVHYRALQWCQALLNALSVGLLYLCGMLLWDSRRASLVAGLALSFDFVNAIHCTFVLTDILFVLAVTIALLLLIRVSLRPDIASIHFLWAGLTLSWAALIRPLALYAFILPTGGLLLLAIRPFKQKALLGTLLFVAGAITPSALWVTRNAMVAGQWTFSSIQGAELYLTKAATLYMQQHPQEMGDVKNRLRQQWARSERLPEAAIEEGNIREAAKRFILDHKREYARLMIHDTLKLLTGNSLKIAAWAIFKDDRYAPNNTSHPAPSSPFAQARQLGQDHPTLGIALATYLILLCLMYGLACIGCWYSILRHGYRITGIVLSTTFYLAAVTIAMSLDAQARYRLPLMPLIFLMAGGGWDMLFRRKEAIIHKL